MSDKQNNTPVKVKNIKFTQDEVNKLFKMFNDNKMIRNMCAGYGSPLSPTRLENFYNPEQVKNLVTTEKFNTTCTIDCGHVYENFPEGGRSREERLADGKLQVEELIKEMSHIIKNSNDDLYKTLKVEVVNKDIDLVYTKIDRGDDGDDHFGIQLFISIHY